MYEMNPYDVIVVGAGHAGCEAALAAARLGMKTALFTLSLDQIANLPCNPCIGGTAKGQLVAEIDCLGGEMGRAADANTIQSRMLNVGKGPAVHSLRAQIDRISYHNYMKNVLEQTENLDIKQGEVVDVEIKDGKVCGAITVLGAYYPTKAVIITTGTYLNGAIHIGENTFASGPDNVRPSTYLTENLRKLGITVQRFKTGTPARVHKRSLDFEKMERQYGDEPITPFCFDSKAEIRNWRDCFMTYTNAETHKVIIANIHRSPMYSGRIHGTGARYCPSIEDKIVRFKDKERHQLFLEPMGLNTDEYYVQGMSTSLPEDVQVAFMKTIPGLENVEVMRPAYAIEYDCCDPLQLYPTLEFIDFKGLYGAGQFNGTSGYEEAGAQGLVAGINAARAIIGEASVILERSGSYIGTLIDDLVTKGCNEPYRMMTSRSEYRLLLRQDNAPERLLALGNKIGLVSDERIAELERRTGIIQAEIARINKKTIAPSDRINTFLVNKGTSPLSTGFKFADLIKRPQLTYEDISYFDDEAPQIPIEFASKIDILVKYEGYIAIQEEQIKKTRALEDKTLPINVDYKAISGLRIEAQEKLNRVKPLNIGQASRISGVNPADISVLLIWLARNGGKNV